METTVGDMTETKREQKQARSRKGTEATHGSVPTFGGLSLAVRLAVPVEPRAVESFTITRQHGVGKVAG